MVTVTGQGDNPMITVYLLGRSSKVQGHIFVPLILGVPPAACSLGVPLVFFVVAGHLRCSYIHLCMD